MNWNEIKMHLAPVGSQIRINRDASIGGSDNAASSVVTVYLPLTIEPRPVKGSVVELWFETAGFRAIQIKLQSSKYEWQDILASIVTDRGLLANIIFHFKAEANLRERVTIWESLVHQICELYRLQLVDPVEGLVPCTEFQKLIERSFAWGYFIEMEKWRKFA
jgi:hypothetical protein